MCVFIKTVFQYNTSRALKDSYSAFKHLENVDFLRNFMEWKNSKYFKIRTKWLSYCKFKAV